LEPRDRALGVRPVAAEALRTKGVRDAHAADLVEASFDDGDGVEREVAERDGEAISAQVAGAELVPVAPCVEDRDVREGEP